MALTKKQVEAYKAVINEMNTTEDFERLNELVEEEARLIDRFSRLDKNYKTKLNIN